MPTRTRLQLTGPCLAFVTTTVIDWIPVFSDKRVAGIAIDQLRQVLTHYQASCMAYVLMPSHLHALIGVSDYTLVAKFMQGYKLLTTKRLKEVSGANLPAQFSAKGRYRFWQPRYDELVIVSERQFRRKVEYIHTNPVRAGLVGEPEEWPYSSAAEWSGKESGIIPIDRDFSFQR